MSFAIFTPEAFPRCLDFPPFFYYSQYYIYILYASFLSNKNQKDNIRGWLCILVCVCLCICTSELSLFFSLQNDVVEVCGALIKKSRHDVAIASVPLKISQTSLHPNVLPSRRKFGEDFEEEAFIYYILEMLPRYTISHQLPISVRRHEKS